MPDLLSNIKELSKEYALELSEVQILVCHFFKINRTQLYTKSIGSQELEKHRDLIKALKQRQLGQPIAQIIGFKDFWTLRLMVNQHTLIPRPETEMIVEKVVSLAPQSFSGEILDLGTGTGAIALSLGSEFPAAKILASDQSVEALEIAKQNQINNKINNVSFLNSNWFKNIQKQTFDFIVSNPPYIDFKDPHLKNLKWEPQSALQAGFDGYSELEIIIKTSVSYLVNEGWLIVEHGYNQGEKVRSLFCANGFENVETDKDLSGMPRITYGQVALAS